MKRLFSVWMLVLVCTLSLMQIAPRSADARKLKVYSLQKEIAPGEMGILIFENPDPSQPKTQSKCTGEKLTGWVKSDIPILRIEQNGKQVWMPLISYQTVGDSSIATYMAPTTLVPGPAQLFLINDHDFSIPYSFTVVKDLKARLIGTLPSSEAKPLGHLMVVSDGTVPEGFIDTKKAADELEVNIGYSKLTKADQWLNLNKRVMKDLDNMPRGNFLVLTQGEKQWKLFSEGCSVAPQGMVLDYILPPNINAGAASVSLSERLAGAEVMQTNSIPITIAP